MYVFMYVGMYVLMYVHLYVVYMHYAKGVYRCIHHICMHV